MPLIELERTQFYIISYDSDESWLYVDWTGHQTPASVRQGGTKLLELVAERGIDRILNDNVHAEGMWIGASSWGALSWYPRIKQAGLQRFAWVYGADPSSNLSADAMLSFMESDPTRVKVFHDIDEAKKWLRQGRHAASQKSE